MSHDLLSPSEEMIYDIHGFLLKKDEYFSHKVIDTYRQDPKDFPYLSIVTEDTIYLNQDYLDNISRKNNDSQQIDSYRQAFQIIYDGFSNLSNEKILEVSKDEFIHNYQFIENVQKNSQFIEPQNYINIIKQFNKKQIPQFLHGYHQALIEEKDSQGLIAKFATIVYDFIKDNQLDFPFINFLIHHISVPRLEQYGIKLPKDYVLTMTEMMDNLIYKDELIYQQTPSRLVRNKSYFSKVFLEELSGRPYFSEKNIPELEKVVYGKIPENIQNIPVLNQIISVREKYSQYFDDQTVYKKPDPKI